MQFNIPTLLTLFRVVLIPFFVLAFYLPVVWAPFACALIFLIAAVTDWFDGYLARRWNQSTRFGAFLVFPPGKKAPDFVLFLGKALPAAVMGMLVVYTFKETVVLSYPYGIPELIALLVTVGLHLWKRNMLVSIAAGTVIYMILIQAVFNVPK